MLAVKSREQPTARREQTGWAMAMESRVGGRVYARRNGSACTGIRYQRRGRGIAVMRAVLGVVGGEVQTSPVDARYIERRDG